MTLQQCWPRHVCNERACVDNNKVPLLINNIVLKSTDSVKTFFLSIFRMVADGAVLKVNERLELEPSWETEGQRPKQLPHVVPVSR